jgi:hypothetical protein
MARVMNAFLHRPQRALWLPALATACGLGLAGIGLFRTAPGPSMVVPPGYVALVNQKGILLSDFRAQVELETTKRYADTTPDERRRTLREMVDEELLVQRAVVLDLPETANEVRANMAVGVNAQVDAPVLAYRPTDAELRAFYAKTRDRYSLSGSMTLRDLVLRVGGYQNADQTIAQAQGDAAEAVYQLRSGAALDYVMAHFGLAPSGRSASGEEPDFAAKLHLGDQLYAVASLMRDGEISDPIVEGNEVHILVMAQHQFPKVADFSAVRDKVYTDFRNAETGRATAENLNLLRSQASILLAPGQSE